MSDVRRIPCGLIKGIKSKHPGVVAYKGIRYATSGRWQYPKEVTSWKGVYEAVEYGPCAIQQRTYVPEETSGRVFYYNEFRKDVNFSYSEDCQYLNIFAPEDAKNAPVIVYIHGGALLGGSSDEKCFRDPVWPKYGVIAVTLNYRLGVFGFLSLPELKEEAGHTGNYGLYDQLVALQWIKHNIAPFGGNPENITIMGQSAGAMSVQHLVSSPLTRGLVNRAVMSSGGGRGRMFGREYASENFYEFWQEVMKRAGAANLAEFRRTDPKVVLDAFGSLLSEDFMKNREACSFTIDGHILPKSIHDTADAHEQLKIPYLIGSNSEDMDPVSMNVDVQEWASEQSEPSYAYYFERQLPGDQAGAFHSADLWYWFGTLEEAWRPFDDRDRKISEQMVQYLIHFASTGNPNGEGLPLWHCGQEKMGLLKFGDDTTQMTKIDPNNIEKSKKVMGW